MPGTSASNCTQCPVNAVSNRGAMDISECVCMQGYYKLTFDDTTPCSTCPTVKLRPASICPGGKAQPYSKKVISCTSNSNTQITDDFGISQKYWASNSTGSTTFMKCFKGVCKAGTAADIETGLGGSLAECGDHASGTLCAHCDEGSFQRGKACLTCPHMSYGVFLYFACPILLMFCFFPIFMYLIGSQIIPSLFISYAHLQRLAVIGGEDKQPCNLSID